MYRPIGGIRNFEFTAPQRPSEYARDGHACAGRDEGNGRKCTEVPEVHIAITAIEKAVASLEHV